MLWSPLLALAVSITAPQSAVSVGAGSAVPVAPATFVRGADGQSTVRAVRLSAPLTLDGRLDEEIYQTTEPASGFFRENPADGERARDDTHVWVFLDDRNVYLAFRCFDSDPERIVANEMKRDSFQIWLNDNVTVVLDTFHDRRSAFMFQTTPLGGVRDALVIDENSTNYDWNTVWNVKSRRAEQGWTSEMAIPFKSLRYPPTVPQAWGFNVTRAARGRNEQSVLAPGPPSTSSALFKLSVAATLVGIEPPGLSRNVEVKPYATSTVTTNRVAVPPISNDVDPRFGFDAKYGITNSLTADFTYNTDFAQVEIDEQQVNLTRFSLFFPEQRDFFLEGRSVFDFAGLGAGGGIPSASAGDRPVLFFSRRIGLNQGRRVPIRAGGRVTGRVGRTSIGVLDIQAEDNQAAAALATNFLVARVKRDILRRSSIGMIATRRSPALIGRGSNEVYGIDASLFFYTNVQINSYYARSSTPGRSGDEESYRGQFRYIADRYALELERLKVGAAFNPEVGFIQRPNVTLSHVLGRFSPRPAIRGVRKVSWEGAYDRYVSPGGRVESALARGTFRVDFNNSDDFIVNMRRSREFLLEPFSIAGVTVPVGGYDFDDVQVVYDLGPQRRISGSVSATRGAFYAGDRTGLSYSGRIKFSPQLALEPRVSVDRGNLPEGLFTTTLAGGRVTYTISPRMFVSVLTQYNSTSDTLETNARFRWEYQPGSDLFVVYTDGRDTQGSRVAELVNRGFAVKFTRLFRF